MTSIGSDLEHTLVIERELWNDGPPHELFRELRSQCPVHWSKRIPEYSEEKGYWSVTTADDIHAVSRDWRTYSSEFGGITGTSPCFSITRFSFSTSGGPPAFTIAAISLK